MSNDTPKSCMQCQFNNTTCIAVYYGERGCKYHKKIKKIRRKTMRNVFDYNGGNGIVLNGTITENYENKVRIKKLYEDAILPHKGSNKAAAYDVHAYLPDKTDVEIKAHETVKIGTGLAMALPEGYFMGVYARSGLSTKEGLRPANCVGICDEDYRGEYIVALHNDSKTKKVIKHGDRIGQIVLQPRVECSFVEVDELDETERGTGGFGSTGVN